MSAPSEVSSPEERVLKFLVASQRRSPRGLPLHRLLQQLKGDLSGLDFARLDQALRVLESQGLVKRDWYGPWDFLVMVTPRGQDRLTEPATSLPPPEVSAREENELLKKELDAVRAELDRVYQTLSDVTEKHKLDRETLEEALSQLEVQAQRIHELEEMLSRAPEGDGGASPSGG